MKILISIVALTSVLLSSEFYSKIYPVDSFEVKSSVSGKVVKTYDKFEKKQVNNALIIKIEDYINSIDLKETQNKLKNLEEILSIQEDTYNSYKKVSSKSKLEKDSQRVQVLSTSSSISDLKIRIATLKDTIDNKNIRLKNRYLEMIHVQEGDYVNPGTPLYSAYDLTKGKLEIYLPIGDIDKYKNKTIYLDGQKSDLKINKISKIADSVHISSYKAEIILENPKQFSKLVKIEFK